MITILASGKLVKPPKQGQSAKGTAWTSATIRASVTGNREDEPDNALVNIIAFGTQAATLARMVQGDSIAFTGEGRPTAWQRDDGLHAGLAVTVQEIVTPYVIKKRRGEQPSQQRNQGSGRGQQSHGEDWNDSIGF